MNYQLIPGVLRYPHHATLTIASCPFLSEIFILKLQLHTYIIDHYYPSVRIIDPVSHTTYVVCVNFIHKWRNLQFKVDSGRFVEKLFMAIVIYSQSFRQKSAERKSQKKYFLYFVFDVWPGSRIQALLLINQHTTYQITATSRSSNSD